MPPGRRFTSYRTPVADLVSLSHHVLSSKQGQDLHVEAKYLIEGLALELVLMRARLEDGHLAALGTLPGAGRTYVALRPLSVYNDTHALFRVPSGLRSGVYAVSLKQGSLVSQVYQYVVVLQRGVDAIHVESF